MVSRGICNALTLHSYDLMLYPKTEGSAETAETLGKMESTPVRMHILALFPVTHSFLEVLYSVANEMVFVS